MVGKKTCELLRRSYLQGYPHKSKEKDLEAFSFINTCSCVSDSELWNRTGSLCERTTVAGSHKSFKMWTDERRIIATSGVADQLPAARGLEIRDLESTRIAFE